MDNKSDIRWKAAHAQLERIINQKAGAQVMMAGKLEDAYFYPIDSPKFSGLLPGASFHFFSFFTLHWCLLWLAVIVFSFFTDGRHCRKVQAKYCMWGDGCCGCF